MNNNNLEDEIFDAIIKKAFIDENERAMKQLNINEELLKDYRPSGRHKRAMKKIMKKYTRPPLSITKKIQRTAGILLFVVLISVGVMNIFPNVIATYQQAIIQLFEKYNIFDFNNKSGNVVVGEYSMIYLSQGFSLIDSIELSSRKSYYFEDDKENYIHFTYMLGNLSSVLADNENKKYTPIEINGKEAYILESIDNDNTIIWVSSDVIFHLSGNINASELIKIAKNIK